MAIKHNFVSAKADGGVTSLVQPSNWNAAHSLDPETANKVLASPISGASAAPTFRLFDPNDLVLASSWAWIKEDFFAGTGTTSGEIGECGISTVSNGTTTNLDSNDQNHPGIIQRNAASAIQPVGGLALGVQGGFNPFYTLSSQIFRVTWIIKNDSAALTNYLIRIGIGNSLTGTNPAGGAYFETSATTTPTTWTIAVRQSSSTITNTTSVTIDNSWHRYDISNDGSNVFSYYIDNTLVGTVTASPQTNQPNAPEAFIQTNASQTQTLTFDYMSIAWKVTR